MEHARVVIHARPTREVLGAVWQPAALLDQPPLCVEHDHRIASAPDSGETFHVPRGVRPAEDELHRSPCADTARQVGLVHVSWTTS